LFLKTKEGFQSILVRLLKVDVGDDVPSLERPSTHQDTQGSLEVMGFLEGVDREDGERSGRKLGSAARADAQGAIASHVQDNRT
jgi:hypothetical protein